MSNGASPTENGPTASGPRRPRRIALVQLWVASVLVLSLSIAALAAYLTMRTPELVERVLPPPPPPALPAEAVRRFEALRALNSDLRSQIDALRRELEGSPQCPPGTELESAGGTFQPSPRRADQPAGPGAG